MTTHENPSIGHNNSPEALHDDDALRSVDPETIVHYLAMTYPKETARANALKEALDRFIAVHKDGIATEDQNEKVPDFVRQMMACRKVLESKRKEEKEIFDGAAAAVQGYFRALMEPLENGKKAIERMQTQFLRKKEAEERAKREEEAKRLRKAAEKDAQDAMTRGDDIAMGAAIAASEDADKAEKAATASAADMVRTRGTLGGVATLRKRKVWEVTDISKVPLQYLTINSAMVDAHKKDWDEGQTQPIPGVTFSIEKTASNR